MFIFYSSPEGRKQAHDWSQSPWERMQELLPSPSLYQKSPQNSSLSWLGTGLRAGRGGLIKNPNKALQPLAARGRSWAPVFFKPTHQRGPQIIFLKTLSAPGFIKDAEGLRGPTRLPSATRQYCHAAHTSPTPVLEPPPVTVPLLRNGPDSIIQLPVGLSGSTYYGQIPAPGSPI